MNAVKYVMGLVAVFSLFVILFGIIGGVYGAEEDVRINSYSYYVAPEDTPIEGDLVVVGEVENVGQSNLNFVRLRALVYTDDGALQAVYHYNAYGEQLLPGQKAPFFMDIGNESSTWGNMSWLDLGINRVDLTVTLADETTDYQYSGLEVAAQTVSIELNGTYTVVGIVQNKGEMSASTYWVVGTFYDSSGTAIATGFTNFLSPDPLYPNATSQFQVAPQYFPLDKMDQIASYSLLVQTRNPMLPEFPSVVLVAVLMVAVGAVVVFFKKKAQK